MMNNVKNFILFFICIIFFGKAAFPNDIQECRGIAEGIERLECYDSIPIEAIASEDSDQLFGDLAGLIEYEAEDKLVSTGFDSLPVKTRVRLFGCHYVQENTSIAGGIGAPGMQARGRQQVYYHIFSFDLREVDGAMPESW